MPINKLKKLKIFKRYDNDNNANKEVIAKINAVHHIKMRSLISSCGFNFIPIFLSRQYEIKIAITAGSKANSVSEDEKIIFIKVNLVMIIQIIII